MPTRHFQNRIENCEHKIMNPPLLAHQFYLPPSPHTSTTVLLNFTNMKNAAPLPLPPLEPPGTSPNNFSTNNVEHFADGSSVLRGF